MSNSRAKVLAFKNLGKRFFMQEISMCTESSSDVTVTLRTFSLRHLAVREMHK